MRRAALAVAIAACTHSPSQPGANEPAPMSAHAAATLGPGPGTAVVPLAAGAATPILVGPFAVTAINPGSDLELALSPDGGCRADLAWFGYSGGGVAVGAGETLCARTGKARTHAFSGHD